PPARRREPNNVARARASIGAPTYFPLVTGRVWQGRLHCTGHPRRWAPPSGHGRSRLSMEVGRDAAPVRSGRVESERLIGLRRLRGGLHGLVAVLAAAVAVRALVLGAAHTPVIVTLVAAVMVIVGVGAAGPRGPVARELWLGV